MIKGNYVTFKLNTQEKPNNITIYFKIFLLPKSISVSIVCIKKVIQQKNRDLEDAQHIRNQFYQAEENFALTFHADRTSCCNCNNCHSCRHAAAGFTECPGNGKTHLLPQQSFQSDGRRAYLHCRQQ